jgi:hypothetical protein
MKLLPRLRGTGGSGRKDLRSGVFICHRVSDSPNAALTVYELLCKRIGKSRVFMDRDIPAAVNYVTWIATKSGASGVLIVIIGPNWLARTADGLRRIDDVDDVLRNEIVGALERHINVLPVLVDGANMPSGADLPAPLASLADIEAHELRTDEFAFESRRTLAELVADLLGKPLSERLAGFFRQLSRHFRLRHIVIGAALLLVVVIGIGVRSLLNSAQPISFADDFATTEYGWPTTESSGPGGRYVAGTYQVSTVRTDSSWGVMVSPENDAESDDVRMKVDAHRIRGSASEGYGYGIFCRAADESNLYTFTIWAQHATIDKRTNGKYSRLGPEVSVAAPPEGDPDKTLQASCASVDQGRAVKLQFWVDETPILNWTDPDPLDSGSFGLHTSMGKGGEIGDTLVVEFDDFEIKQNELR